MGTYQLIHSVKVPICRACKRTVERIPIVVWVLAALAITALSAGGAGWDRDSSMAGRILGGGFVGASLGALAAYVADRLCAPAKLDSGGRLEFHSWAYQKLFEGQLPPEAGPVLYSLLQSLKCGRCGQVYPSHNYFRLLKNPDGITFLCNTCYEGLDESEKPAAGVSIKS